MSTEIYLGNPPENIKKWIKENYKPKKNVPLHFTANEPNSSVSLIAFDWQAGRLCDSWCEFEYSTDEMKTWNDYDGHVVYLDDCENKTMYIQAKYGDTEDNPNRNGLATYTYYEEDNRYRLDKFHQFIMEGSVKAGGNIQFLLDNTGLRIDVPALCYRRIFAYCSSLTQAPELKAETLTNKCYEGMFLGCTSLTKAPELPATELADSCYYYMFSGCTSLTQAPELPATELADSCYYYMFNSCKSPFTFPNKTFDEVASLIQEQNLIGDYYWYYYDEEDNEVVINPIEIICSDKTMIATFNENESTWTLTEK